MDVHKDSIQFHRLEIVETGRRRRWSLAEKQRIVAESFSGPRQVATTARRYGISRGLLYSWRRALRAIDGLPSEPVIAAVPEVRSADPADGQGRIEIVLPSGIQLTVEAGIDPSTLHRIVRALA